MSAAFRFDPVELPPECDALPAEVREFIAGKLATGLWAPNSDFKRYGGGERSMLERYVVTEELLGCPATRFGSAWAAGAMPDAQDQHAARFDPVPDDVGTGERGLAQLSAEHRAAAIREIGETVADLDGPCGYVPRRIRIEVSDVPANPFNIGQAAKVQTTGLNASE